MSPRTRAKPKPRRQPLSAEAQAWFDELKAGWEWEPHELEVLRIAAEAYDRYQQAKREIDRDGATVLDRFNQRKPHPAHVIERDSRSAFLMALRQLRFEEPAAQVASLLALPTRRGRRGA